VRTDAELIEIAKNRYGLTRAAYLVEQAFAHLGVKPSYGYELISHSILPNNQFRSPQDADQGD
jgi:hypothetical protein